MRSLSVGLWGLLPAEDGGEQERTGWLVRLDARETAGENPNSRGTGCCFGMSGGSGRLLICFQYPQSYLSYPYQRLERSRTGPGAEAGSRPSTD